MQMEAEYDELLEMLACARAVASITGRELPQKYRNLMLQAMDLRHQMDPESPDSVVLDEVHARTRAICKDFGAAFAKAIAKGFASQQTQH